MRKKIKLAAVLSTAAFLAICTSLTSFAASGWMEENGGWAYYDAKGERVTEGWVKDGEFWYWLDENGTMVSNGLFQIREDYYYFREDGTMVSEQWVAVPNENAGEEDEPEQYWYYFQKSGKAYRRPDSASSGSLKAKTIDGKKYAFDTEGRMLYGWVSEGERQTGEDAWEYSDYYFGTENDGFMQQGWARLSIVADGVEDEQPGEDFWDEDQERWFYFGANGKKVKAKEEGDYRLKTINGNQYGFDEYGRMIGSWYADPDAITLATNRTEAAADGKTEYQGQASYTKKFMYFGTPESGVRYKKGWFRAMPSEYLMKAKYDEQEVYTYYADKDGYLCANEIKTIDGERYGFDNAGRLLTGLVCVRMEDEDSSSKFESSFYSDATVREGRAPFGEESEFDELVETYAEDFQSHKMRFYWFGGTNGTMLTGKQNVPLIKGDETFEFMFETSGKLKGSGVYGERKGRLYKAGKLQKPEEGDRYAIFKMAYTTLPEDATEEEKAAFAKKDLDGDGKIDGVITRISVKEFMSEVCNSGIHDEDKEETVWTVRYEPEDVTYYLIGANGNIIKNKKKAVDVDGYQFWVKNKRIQTITVED